jgi:hypothetical protein
LPRSAALEIAVTLRTRAVLRARCASRGPRAQDSTTQSAGPGTPRKARIPIVFMPADAPGPASPAGAALGQQAGAEAAATAAAAAAGHPLELLESYAATRPELQVRAGWPARPPRRAMRAAMPTACAAGGVRHARAVASHVGTGTRASALEL